MPRQFMSLWAFWLEVFPKMIRSLSKRRCEIEGPCLLMVIPLMFP
ncbi:hypothetical protein CIPAW_11G209100 [Carya illinoinensis]|uniref:Uncharacterized protein n=1 Tax=Carya illinoinensis TaxID=32201 RepID=A0A8T1P237_CARIL|nr:hypothetical protein CIPAW_11G209100 [Carya illinoinensis]